MKKALTILVMYSGLALTGVAGIWLVATEGNSNFGDAPVSVSAESLDDSLAVVSDILKDSPEDARRLSELYKALSDMIERDGSIVKTTGQVKEANSRAGQLLFQKTGMRGKHEGLAEAVDAVLKKSLGEVDVMLTEDKRRDAVEAFLKLSQACAGGGA
jgi:hypothetical protein